MEQCFIASMGMLHPYRSQTDIWLSAVNPNHPAPGNIRFVFQCVEMFNVVIYAERFGEEGIWETIDLPDQIQLVDLKFGALQNRMLIAGNAALPEMAIGPPAISAYYVSWPISDRFAFFSADGNYLYYIQHDARTEDQIRPDPLPDADPVPIAMLELIW